MANIEWSLSPAGVELSVRAVAGLVQVDRWSLEGLQAANGRPASIAPLLRVIDGDDVVARSDTSVTIPHLIVAGLSENELKLLTLPVRRDPIIAVRSRGALPDAEFALEVGLSYPGRVQKLVSRVGAVVHDADEKYVLSEWTFRLLESIDQFNVAPPKDLEERLRAWGRIRALATDEVQFDNYLAELRIVVASRFALRPFVNAAKEADFEISLVDPVKGEPLLSDARHEAFNRGFRGFPTIRGKYPAGGGLHVVLDLRVQGAVVAVHRAQNGTAKERRDFLRAPHAHIRAGLPEGLLDMELSDVFQDAGLSDRVVAVGLYEPHVLPWLVRKGTSWLPPERAGLRVGDRQIELSREEAQALLGQVTEAAAGGKAEVHHGADAIPASDETRDALEHIIREFELPGAPPRPPEDSAEEPSPEEPGGKQVLQIFDNLELLGYKTTEAKRSGFPRSLEGLLQTPLLPHQVEALDAVMSHYERGRPGVLIADDMGLGKTLTALAFLSWLKSLQSAGLVPEKPFLLVAPTGLLRNWVDESTKRLSPTALRFRVEAHGMEMRALRTSPMGTKELRVGLPVLDFGRLQRADWVLTTYETLRDYQHSFGRVAWGCIVFDEAQKIKNPAVAMTDAAKAMNADFRVAMTGTPVENRLADLWSIVDAVHPGRLGTLKTFVGVYEGDGDDVRASLRALRAELTAPPPFMIRRLKETHLVGLPKREFHLEREVMPAEQATAYSDAVRRARAPNAQPLEFLQEFRRISLHPRAPATGDDTDFVAASARMRVLFRCLDRVKEANEKALVFLEDLEMQGHLAGVIQRRYGLAKPPLIISGQVPGQKRKGRVDAFEQRPDFDVMILSPRAAGVGLNIVAANHVIHLTRWWNPAVEDQCNDRVYRIGQTKRVHVYLPSAVHPMFGDSSFDVMLHGLLEEKRERSRQALTPMEVSAQDLGAFFNSVRGAAVAEDRPSTPKG